ncbi:MAG: hypothetical protein N2C14_22315, partial [Planctomycetales bacterium]
VWVTATIDEGIEIHRFEVPRVRNSLLGDATIDFMPGKKQSSSETRELVAEGEEIQGEAAPSPLDALNDLQLQMSQALDTFDNMAESVETTSGNLQTATLSFTATSDEWGTVGRELNKAITGDDGDRLERLMVKTESMIGHVDESAVGVNGIINDPELREDLANIIKQFPETLAEARLALSGVRETVQLADDNLRNLQGFTKPLGENGENIVAKLGSSVEKMDSALSQIGALVAVVNSEQGTVGKFLRDPTLYDNLNASAARVELMLRELRPIIKDVRVFTDKIARPPEVLGLRGAVNRSSGIK